MKVSIVVAASTNNVIGDRGELPWHVPEDLKRFKSITLGKPIVMGRLTHESIGRPLPGRQNIVLSSDAAYRASGCSVVDSVAAALELAGNAEEVMIIGGGHIYEQFLPLAGRIYLTRVHAQVDGDAWFPEIDSAQWRCVSCEEHPGAGDDAPGFSFCLFERR
jgi:dihydrofolate reductase